MRFIITIHTRSNYQIAFNIIVTNNLFIPIARTTSYGLKLTKVIGPKIYPGKLGRLLPSVVLKNLLNVICYQLTMGNVCQCFFFFLILNFFICFSE